MKDGKKGDRENGSRESRTVSPLGAVSVSRGERARRRGTLAVDFHALNPPPGPPDYG